MTKNVWEKILGECEELIDSAYTERRTGHVYNFFGLVHGGDDYYYGMYSPGHGLRLLSCVGHMDGHGFEKVLKGLSNPDG